MLKKMAKSVDDIGQLEPHLQTLSDDELRAKTEEFKNRASSGEDSAALLVEAFAVTREASYRVLNMRHFDVQLIGGMVLNEGRIAEMRTGEGKTRPRSGLGTSRFSPSTQRLVVQGNR